MKSKNNPHYYAAVIVINTDGEVLLGKRAEDGIYTTPAGGAEPGEENPLKTAVRELFEESGIPADERFLQSIGPIETANKKLCHRYLYVVATGTKTSSKLDPDQEVKKWGWYKINDIPEGLRQDKRRFDSVREGYMKYHGITKSLIDSLEKGGKPAQVGEVRNYGGTDYRKMGNGQWEPVVHPEEKQLKAEESKKVVSLTSKLKEKIEEKNTISHTEKHLSDMKNQTVIEGKQTRSGKPMFTNVDSALAHGYEVTDYREVANVFYDRAQKMADNIAKLEAAKQKVDPNLEKIKKENMKAFRSFVGQALRIENRQAKMKKSVVGMAHLDGAEVNTADFAIEHALAGDWLDRIQGIMAGYSYGDEPRVIYMDEGDLHLVKVDDGMYSGAFKKMTQIDGETVWDNAKVRIERMTLPSLVQFCMAKEWIKPMRDITPEIAPAPVLESLAVKLETPLPPPPPPIVVESSADKTLRFMDLLTKLLS